MHKIQKSSKDVRKRRHVRTPGARLNIVRDRSQHHTVTTNTSNTMDVILILISLSFHYANAAPYEQRRRFVERQLDSSSSQPPSSSNPTQTSLSTTLTTPERSLPASIRTRIPVSSSTNHGGEVQTAIPAHPDASRDKGPIIGFSIGIVALVLLFVATGWSLFLYYKHRKQQQAASKDAVQLQQTDHSASSTTKKSLHDTQSAVSQLRTSDSH